MELIPRALVRLAKVGILTKDLKIVLRLHGYPVQRGVSSTVTMRGVLFNWWGSKLFACLTEKRVRRKLGKLNL